MWRARRAGLGSGGQHAWGAGAGPDGSAPCIAPRPVAHRPNQSGMVCWPRSQTEPHPGHCVLAAGARMKPLAAPALALPLTHTPHACFPTYTRPPGSGTRTPPPAPSPSSAALSLAHYRGSLSAPHPLGGKALPFQPMSSYLSFPPRKPSLTAPTRSASRPRPSLPGPLPCVGLPMTPCPLHSLLPEGGAGLVSRNSRSPAWAPHK